jgi:hypothetical protein
MSNHPNPAAVQAAHQFVADVRTRVGKVVVGQDIVVERVMIALLTGGHLLLQGMPGLAKTLLVNTVAKAIALDFRRIQFTVDMLPSDIVGSEVVDQKTGDFRIHRGPVFTNLLLAQAHTELALQDVLFFIAIGITEAVKEHETVKLRFRQFKGTGLLDGVLRRDDEERRR